MNIEQIQAPVAVEISQTLVDDVETALQHLLAQFIPPEQFSIWKFQNDEGIGLKLTLYSEVYPRFIKIGKNDIGPIRPTNHARKLLGLPERE